MSDRIKRSREVSRAEARGSKLRKTTFETPIVIEDSDNVESTFAKEEGDNYDEGSQAKYPHRILNDVDKSIRRDKNCNELNEEVICNDLHNLAGLMNPAVRNEDDYDLMAARESEPGTEEAEENLSQNNQSREKDLHSETTGHVNPSLKEFKRHLSNEDGTSKGKVKNILKILSESPLKNDPSAVQIVCEMLGNCAKELKLSKEEIIVTSERLLKSIQYFRNNKNIQIACCTALRNFIISNPTQEKILCNVSNEVLKTIQMHQDSQVQKEGLKTLLSVLDLKSQESKSLSATSNQSVPVASLATLFESRLRAIQQFFKIDEDLVRLNCIFLSKLRVPPNEISSNAWANKVCQGVIPIMNDDRYKEADLMEACCKIVWKIGTNLDASKSESVLSALCEVAERRGTKKKVLLQAFGAISAVLQKSCGNQSQRRVSDAVCETIENRFKSKTLMRTCLGVLLNLVSKPSYESRDSFPSNHLDAAMSERVLRSVIELLSLYYKTEDSILSRSCRILVGMSNFESGLKVLSSESLKVTSALKAASTRIDEISQKVTKNSTKRDLLLIWELEKILQHKNLTNF